MGFNNPKDNPVEEHTLNNGKKAYTCKYDAIRFETEPNGHVKIFLKYHNQDLMYKECFTFRLGDTVTLEGIEGTHEMKIVYE